MHEKQDYIMMQIEQLGRVLGKILADLLGLKTGNVSGRYEMFAQSLKTELDTDVDQLIEMSDHVFKAYVSEVLLQSPKLYNQLAVLLIEAAKDQTDIQKSIKLYQKALILYKMEIDETRTFSVFMQKRMTEIENTIQLLKRKI